MIPDQNDDAKELTEITRFIADVDAGVPWHINRIRPNYQFTDAQATFEERARAGHEFLRTPGRKS
jgi:pyruvate-formate lyase-activating enzyme